MTKHYDSCLHGNAFLLLTSNIDGINTTPYLQRNRDTDIQVKNKTMTCSKKMTRHWHNTNLDGKAGIGCMFEWIIWTATKYPIQTNRIQLLKKDWQMNTWSHEEKERSHCATMAHQEVNYIEETPSIYRTASLWSYHCCKYISSR